MSTSGRRRQAPRVDAVIATALRRDRAGVASPEAAAVLAEVAEARLSSIYTDTGLLSQAVGGARTVIDGDHSLGDLVSRWRRLQAETRDARAAVVGALAVGEAAGAPVAQLARELGVTRTYVYRLLDSGGER